MTFLRKLRSGIVLFIMAAMLFSCNVEDFNLNKLANPDDIIPELFAPLAYGKFIVGDLVTVSVPDAFPIPTGGGLPLNPVTINKTGSSFRNAAVDSVYLIVHVTNDTPVDMEFELSFLASPTGPAIGTKTFFSGPIKAGTKEHRIQFELGPTDQDNLMNSTDIGINFILVSPSPGSFTYGAVKTKPFTVKISFYSPVKLWELTK